MMVKKKLFMSLALLLMLMLSLFALIPAQVAHADSCNGQCGQDPVVAGCAANQYIVTARDFQIQNETWEIRLRRSYVSGCTNEAWASLVIVSSGNPWLYYNNQDIAVTAGHGPYDYLYSSQFGSGAYTNMVQYVSGDTCVQYDGNGIHAGICG